MTDFEKARDEAAAKYANGNYGSYHMDLQAFKAGADWARRELDADIHVNHCGHIVKWEDLCRRFEDVSFEVQKERDALKAEVDRLKDQLDKAQEGERFYRGEWESACERYNYAMEERDALKAELKLYMQSEKIWQDNCGVAGRDALPKEREKSKRLAEALKYIGAYDKPLYDVHDEAAELKTCQDRARQALEEFEGEKE
jgi:hypothetical protein